MARLLTQEEAARILRIQPRTLEAWRSRGKGPQFVRYSATAIRYRRADLESFITEHIEERPND